MNYQIEQLRTQVLQLERIVDALERRVDALERGQHKHAEYPGAPALAPNWGGQLSWPYYPAITEPSPSHYPAITCKGTLQ